jgi:CheY-like chemotaxis protein
MQRQPLHLAVAQSPGSGHHSARGTSAPFLSAMQRPQTRLLMATVLLVDDEHFMRGVLRKLFERAGLGVLEADSGRRALELIASEPGISAVVSDFLMPEINGLDFYDALLAQSPHLKERVVFLTGAARDPQVHQSLEQRGVPLISKLDDLDIVLDAVKLALLRRHSA